MESGRYVLVGEQSRGRDGWRVSTTIVADRSAAQGKGADNEEARHSTGDRGAEVAGASSRKRANRQLPGGEMQQTGENKVWEKITLVLQSIMYPPKQSLFKNRRYEINRAFMGFSTIQSSTLLLKQHLSTDMATTL